MITLLFFNTLIFIVKAFDNKIVFEVTFTNSTNSTLEVVCTSAKSVYYLKNSENFTVLFNTTKIINSAICTTLSNNKVITKSDIKNSKIISDRNFVIEKMVTKRDFTSDEGHCQKLMCKFLTLRGLTKRMNERHQVIVNDMVYNEHICTADIHILDFGFLGLDRRAVLRQQMITDFHTVYHFYPNEVLHFQCGSSYLGNEKLFVVDTYGTLVLNKRSELKVDCVTNPLSENHIKEQYIECKLETIYERNIIMKKAIIERQTLELRLGPVQVVGLPKHTEVTRHDWGLLYNYHFVLNESLRIECKTTENYDYPLLGSFKNMIRRLYPGRISFHQLLNKDDDGKQINCTILEDSIATSLRTIIINLTLKTDRYINLVPTKEIAVTPTIVADMAKCSNRNNGRIVWLMIGITCGALISGAIVLGFRLFHLIRAKQSKKKQVQINHSPSDDHVYGDNVYADVYEDRLRIIKQIEPQPVQLPLKIWTKPTIPSHQMIAPASDLYLLKIDSDGYQIPDEVRSKGIQYDMTHNIK